MFGYHAAAWVKANRLLPPDQRSPNPFADLVRVARAKTQLHPSTTAPAGDAGAETELSSAGYERIQ